MKRLDKKFLFYFVLIFIILATSCKKKLNTNYISDGLKEWVAFKPGSYWIYKNDSTGELDSAYCGANYSQIRGGDQEGGYFQDITLKINSKFIDSYFLTFLCAPISFRDYKEMFFMNLIKNGNQVLPMLAFNSNFPYNKEEILCHSQTTRFIVSYKDSVIINGLKYFNVLYNREWSIKDSTNVVEMYITKNIGLIKLTDSIKTHWSLLRYHVVQ
jgi:hypothetical protein